MKYLIKVIGAIIISQYCYSQRIDLSVTERYFQLTDSLRENIPLSDESWNSFIEMNGMRQYISNQHLELEMDGYRQSMEYVYMPQHDSLLQQFLKQPDIYNKTYLVYQYRELETELKNYIRQIRNRPDIYLDSMYENAYSMLPYKRQLTSITTNIYFVPLFEVPAADNYDILLSLYGNYYLDHIRYGASGGHVLHHLLRRNRKLASPKDQQLYAVLTAVLDEGMADLIDKPMPDSVDCPAHLKYGEQMLKSPDSAIVILDSAIQMHIAGKQPFDSANGCNIVQLGGHVPGYQMALVIERNGLADEMIKYADNPLRFLLLYNRAALLDEKKPTVFSDKTVLFIKNLQKKLRR